MAAKTAGHIGLAVRPLQQDGRHFSSNPNPDPNPFSSLPFLPPSLALLALSSLLPSLPSSSLSSLLPQTLNPNPNLLPLSLPILQYLFRSGLPPPPSTPSTLSLSWLLLRRRHGSAVILSSLSAIGLRPNLTTLNYLLSCLCHSSQPSEAVEVLTTMAAAGVSPDATSYSVVIEAVEATEGERIVREIVANKGMVPRKGAVVRVVRGLGKMGMVMRAVELVRFLEREGCGVGFEGYEAAVEGCLGRGEVVAAARVVVEMVSKGFVPYIGVRRRVVEGLVRVGKWEVAVEVRRRLAEI